MSKEGETRNLGQERYTTLETFLLYEHGQKPDLPVMVNGAWIAKEIGITKQTVSLIISKIKERHPDLAIIRPPYPLFSEEDLIIKELLTGRQFTVSEIAEAMERDESAVRNSIILMLKKGLIPVPPRTGRKSWIKDQEVGNLKLRGMKTKEIAATLKTNTRDVETRIRRLYRRGDLEKRPRPSLPRQAK